jgi:hypothetical protein
MQDIKNNKDTVSEGNTSDIHTAAFSAHCLKWNVVTYAQ